MSDLTTCPLCVAYEETERLLEADRLIVTREIRRHVRVVDVRMPTVIQQMYPTTFVYEAYSLGVRAGVGELRRRVRKSLAVTRDQGDWAYARREPNRMDEVLRCIKEEKT